MIRRLAVAGEGIAYKSFLMSADDLREGRSGAVVAGLSGRFNAAEHDLSAPQQPLPQCVCYIKR